MWRAWSSWAMLSLPSPRTAHLEQRALQSRNPGRTVSELLGDKIADIRQLFTVENERRVWTFDDIEARSIAVASFMVIARRGQRLRLETDSGHEPAVRGSEELGRRWNCWR